MRKLMILAAVVSLAAGCSSQDKSGIGVVPLQGATLTGKVVEASEPSGVLMKTQSDRSFLLPDDWSYQHKGKPVAVKDLSPGSTVTAIAPAQQARLVTASDNNLVLESDRGFFSFPAEGLAPEARQAPVQVQTFGGRYQEMPLMQAMHSYPTGVMSHPYYQDYAFPTASPYTMAKGVPVGSYMNSPLVLAPTSQGVSLVSLPPAYPMESFSNHQPVRFTYRDDNVAVSSWNTLGDSQFNLSNLLLAGTLLDVLPGQAVIQVGQSPLTVPWSYVTHQGAPVGDRRFPVGTPLNVAYYPGAYDLISYDNSNVTLLYDQYPVQIPASYLPNYAYNRPVRVRRGQGQWVSMPFQAACQLVDTGNYSMAPSPVARPYIDLWCQTPAWDPRPIRSMPDYHLVGWNGHGPARAVRKKRHQRHHHQPDGWWARQPDWSYTVAGLAGPAAWNAAHQYRDKVTHRPVYRDQGRHLGWKEKSRKKKGPGQVAWSPPRADRPWWVDDRRRPQADSKRRVPRHDRVRQVKREEKRQIASPAVWAGAPERYRHDERKRHPRFGKKERRTEKQREDKRAPLVRRDVPRQQQRQHRAQAPRQQQRQHRAPQAPRQQQRQHRAQAPRQQRQHRVSQAPRQQQRQHRVSQAPRQQRHVSHRQQGAAKQQRDGGRRGERGRR